MAGFGERLRRERELRGVKLEEIAESTKIGVRYLRALEDEDLTKLPGGIFSKGFVRAYARYLGIDEEEAIADFVHVAGESENALPEASALPEKPQVETHSSKWWLVLALLALIAVGYYYRQRTRTAPPAAHPAAPQPAPPKPAPQQAEPSATVPVTTPTAPPAGTVAATEGATGAPGGTATAAPPPETAAPSAARVVVELRTTHPAWVQWSVDGGPAQDAVFPANAQKRLEGKARVTLKVGDAGAVALTYNGKTMSPLGKDKQVMSLTFTPEGMQE